MTFYDNTLKYFKECRIAYADRFAPYFVSSACCHITNLENQKREFALDGGRVANFRMHTFFVAPPGYMKTLMLSKLLEGPHSVLGGSKIGTGFEGAMTEAGYVGTIKAVDGEPTVAYGAAYDHRESILGIDEFAQLTNAMKMEHSINLDTAMLTSLDSGFLNKRMALGKIRYVTHLTLWSGSQPSRFDLSSGLGRRLMFILFIPTGEEEARIRQARREGKNVPRPTETLKLINEDVNDILERLENVERVEFGKSVYNTLDALKIPHYEEELFERMALGYTVATQPFEKKIVVEMDIRLKGLIERANNWRSDIKMGTEFTQAIQVIKEMSHMSESDIKKRLANLGWTWQKSGEILRQLENQKAITRTMQAKTATGGRPKRIIVVNED